MAIFPISGVLRGFMPSTYYQYASGINPCAALLIEKISHFLIVGYSLDYNRDWKSLPPGQVDMRVWLFVGAASSRESYNGKP
ncbi:MAG: hypothetical protein GQ571_08830 [Desulfobacterales bacterium]|nr:hypothetical protein [Desulfobacterales bacterium]